MRTPFSNLFAALDVGFPTRYPFTFLYSFPPLPSKISSFCAKNSGSNSRPVSSVSLFNYSLGQEFSLSSEIFPNTVPYSKSPVEISVKSFLKVLTAPRSLSLLRISCGIFGLVVLSSEFAFQFFFFFWGI